MACFEWFYSEAPPSNLQVLAACIFLMGTFTKIEHVLFSTLQDIFARCIVYTMKVQLATFSKNRNLSNNFARQLAKRSCARNFPSGNGAEGCELISTHL